MTTKIKIIVIPNRVCYENIAVLDTGIYKTLRHSEQREESLLVTDVFLKMTRKTENLARRVAPLVPKR